MKLGISILRPFFLLLSACDETTTSDVPTELDVLAVPFSSITMIDHKADVLGGNQCEFIYSGAEPLTIITEQRYNMQTDRDLFQQIVEATLNVQFSSENYRYSPTSWKQELRCIYKSNYGFICATASAHEYNCKSIFRYALVVDKYSDLSEYVNSAEN